MKTWSKSREYSLVLITAPAKDKGQVFLKIKTEMWNWVPSIDKTIKIPPSMMLQSWMGSDFTNDDLVRESSYRKDFDARLEGRSVDPPGWTLVLEARPGVVGRWARITLTVGDDQLPLRMD